MDVSEQIRKFHEFFESSYHAELAEKIRKGEKFLIVDFAELTKFSPELAELLLEQPEDTIKAAEKAVEQFDFEGEIKDFRIRINNLPDNRKIMIKNIRSIHISKLLAITGLVRQKSDVRPQVTIARFECPSCGELLVLYQTDQTFKEPSKCKCGRKGKFRLIGKELVDAQRLVLEEAPEDLEGGEQPKRMTVILKGDLVSPISERKTNPGSKICVIGTVNEVPIIAKTGAKSITFDLMIDGNYVDAKEESYADLQISPEEEEKILELSKDPDLIKKLVNSIAPSIYGHEKVKEALLLQMLSGVRKVRDDGSITRGDIHVLLVGDPGAGKSQLLKRVSKIAPKSRYVSGKGVSGAGLTAAVVRDEFLKGWSLEAGALALTNKGICIIDEFDKMNKEDRDAMHEALEQQTISIAKANIQATLRSETTVLAAANPKHGRFDHYKNIIVQIDLPPTLISRFDLIFPIKDIPNVDRDTAMAAFILKIHSSSKIENSDVSTEDLKKYLIYARQKIRPELTPLAFDAIKNYYVEMRRSAGGEGEGGARVTITARQLEALVRLSEASAKTRLSLKIERDDAQRAIDLVNYCLDQVAKDRETGKLDIDIISTGVSASQRNKIGVVKEVIDELDNKLGKAIPIEEVIKLAVEKGMRQAEVEEIVEKLRRGGEIFEPRRGVIQKL